MWMALLLLCDAHVLWAQAPVSSTVPVGNAAHHKIYSASSAVNTLAGIVADIGANTVTAAIYGTLLYGASSTVPPNLTLDLTHGMINCNNVANAVTIQGPYIIPEYKQAFTNCPSGSVLISGRSATLSPEMFGGSDWGVQLGVAQAACPIGHHCVIDMTRIAGGTAAAGLVLTKGNLEILFGPYTYTLASGRSLSVNPGAVFIDGVVLRGSGQAATKISCVSGGSPACIYVKGTFASSGGIFQFLIPTPIPVGATTFTAISGDIAGVSLTAGDTIKVSDWALRSGSAPDHQRVNDRTVVSVVGTTVTVDKPFTFDFGLQGGTAWEKISGSPRNVRITDLAIENLAGSNSALYMQAAFDFQVENTRLSKAGSGSGVANFYGSHNVKIINNTFISDITSPVGIMEYSQNDGGLIQGNYFTCGPTGRPIGNGLSLSFGANFTVVDSNRVDCISTDKNGLMVIESDDNTITNNTIAGDTTGIGIDIEGDRNALTNNTTTGFKYGVQLTGTGIFFGSLAWQPNHVYGAFACVAEVPDTGWEFCTQAGGTSGATQPLWNETQSVRYNIPAAGATTTDGTVTWYGMKYHKNNLSLVDNHLNIDIATAGLAMTNVVTNPTIGSIRANTTAGASLLNQSATVPGAVTGALVQARDSSNRRYLEGPLLNTGFVDVRGGLSVLPLLNPSGLAASQGPGPCTSCTTNFSYFVSAVVLTERGPVETAATQIVLSSQDALGPNHKNKLSWSALPGANCFNVYGRTSGSELLLSSCQTATLFSDDGSVIPAGASPPAINNTGQIVSIPSQYTVATLPTYASVLLAMVPQGYWRMNETSGNLTDSSGNSNTAIAGGTGITYGTAGSIRDDLNPAVTMPGSGNPRWSVTTAGSLPSGDVFSAAFAFKKAANGTVMRIINQKINGVDVYLYSDNTLRVAKSGVASEIMRATIPITDTAWHHVVFMKSGATQFLYVDGVDVTTVVSAQTFAPADATLYFGIYHDLAQSNWNGSLDEFAVWNRAVTHTEALSLYAQWSKAKNGITAYATDCTPNTSPATGGGAGSFVKYQQGKWDCAPIP
jgi:hypothetical protein